MNFVESVKTCFTKYADFKGVASRSEFWYFVLFAFLCPEVVASVAPNLGTLVTFGLLVPNLAVGWRRMHDSDHAGWSCLIPFYGFILSFFETNPQSRWANGAKSEPVGGRSCPNGHPVPSYAENFCPACGATLA